MHFNVRLWSISLADEIINKKPRFGAIKPAKTRFNIMLRRRKETDSAPINEAIINRFEFP